MHVGTVLRYGKKLIPSCFEGGGFKVKVPLRVLEEHNSSCCSSNFNEGTLLLCTLCPKKNDTDVTHYRFNPHQPISVIFGRDVAERVCY